MSGRREGKVLFITIAKPGMFGLDIASKENFLAYSTQFIFLIIRLVPGNMVMVATDSDHKGVDIWNYIKPCITFYAFCLFVCLSV